ncbi:MULTISPECIES: winged helix-turn-helix domain-containing protein [Streptomyces]|uniref:helix-turn-helix domain-containing protein n=1 Tax=Streptomyces TaxID=1883 RepID=UPI00099E3651|nr:MULTISPECIES: winged helix-turn-helix domain-containing protein [Streptomyces]MDI5904826.1 winged helix-turn-helix domain-containing protein [Streptomyces sp. 12257]
MQTFRRRISRRCGRCLSCGPESVSRHVGRLEVLAGLLVGGVWRLLHRHGWSWQSPARRARERDEQAVGL